ncbi:MAG TPA: AAA family ATPase [Methylomirabilota bacterium]|nr:AAA family ATPase [Methylomirabilota bacterium]
MPCPQCGHPNPPAAKFCSGCGAPLELRCPACGHANLLGSRFCNECGRALTAPRDAPRTYTPQHLASRILSSRAALDGERKQVTMLLADLKGSMELLADRDPEEARRLLDSVLERMMEAVSYYEGFINQVMGDGIMALFGAPLAHEDHAIRACYAALRMQEQVGRYGDDMQRTLGVPIQIRVGLNSGEVVVRAIGSDLHMDYTAVGQTTHLAGRMQQMAKPGSTLLTHATLRLAEGYVRVRSLGPSPIRGLAEELEVFELLGTGPSRTRLQASAARGLTRFIGRGAELEQLRAALERARAGRGQVVAIVGEPGVGKSRLVLEVAHSHRTDGWLVLEASAVSYGKAAPFMPVVELLKTYLGIEERDDARRVREKLAGKLLTLDDALRPTLPALQALLDVPVDDPAWKSLGADQQRRSAIDGLRHLWLRESAAQPLLVILEDLHWVDADTQALLESLVESLPSHALMLLVNYRPEYQHGWGGKTYYEQIRLDPLAATSAEALVEALLGRDDSLAPLTSLLIARAQGNPFFLEESVRALEETGVLAGERGAHRLVKAVQVVQLPETVQAILASRIDRLAPEDKSLLQSASVVGKDVPLVLLQVIARLNERELSAGLARLQSGEFIYETKLLPQVEYTFKHTLTHEVAYASLLQEHRRALHAELVDAIERLFPGAVAEHRDRLVHHAFRGEVWSKAITYLRDLIAVATPAEIDSVMGSGQESAGQLWWRGEYEHAIRTSERDLQVAASFSNFSMRVIGSCRLAQAHHAVGNYERAADIFRQVLAALQGDLARERFEMAALPSVWARSWLAWTLAELGEFDEGAAVGEEGLAIALSAEHVYSRFQAFFGLGILHLIRGRPESAIPPLEQGVVLARVENVSFFLPFITAPLGAAYALAGRVDAGIGLLEQAIEQAGSMGLVATQSLRLAWLAEAHLMAGRLEPARNHAQRALQLAEDRRERGRVADVQRLLADIEAEKADSDGSAAATAYRGALEAAQTLQMRPVVARCLLGLGCLSRRMGRRDDARRDVADALAQFSAMGMTLWVQRARAALEA